MDMESVSNTTTHRLRLPKAPPIMQTNSGKCYLLIGLGCVLIVIFGIGFILYTVLKNKLLSIGIGTLFAFIVVISAIWCVSTYYDFKMQEAENWSMNTESNTDSYIHDGNSNSPSTGAVSNRSFHYEESTNFPREVYDRYPLSTNSPEQLARDLFPPPPYSEVEGSSIVTSSGGCENTRILKMDSSATVKTTRSATYQNPPSYEEVARMTNLNNADSPSE